MKLKQLSIAGALLIGAIGVTAVINQMAAPSADSAPTATTRYTARELSKDFLDYYYMDLNNSGQIAGSMYFKKDGASYYEAVILNNKGSQIKRLGTLSPEKTSTGVAINDGGVVVGESGLRGYVWNKTMKDLVDLFSTSGTFRVTGINDRYIRDTRNRVVRNDQIIGYIISDSGNTTSVRWTKSEGLKELAESTNPNKISYPTDINNRGDVIGMSDGKGYVYTDKTGLKTLGEWKPNSLNTTGVIVGGTQYPFSGHVYTPTSGDKTLLSSNASWYFALYPNDVNDKNIMVGMTANSFAFVSDLAGTNPINLNTVTRNLPANVRLNNAKAINNRGEILAIGYNSTNQTTRVYLLSPGR